MPAASLDASWGLTPNATVPDGCRPGAASTSEFSEIPEMQGFAGRALHLQDMASGLTPNMA